MKTFSAVFFLFLLTACQNEKKRDYSNQNKEANYIDLSCKEQLAYADDKIMEYYKFDKISSLDTALNVLNHILLTCGLERKAATILKLNVFTLKKEYHEALIFLSKINANYFYHSYEYEFNVYLFKALKYKQVNDKLLETKNLLEARNTVLFFLKENWCNNDALYNYLIVEQLISNKDTVNSIIRKKLIECPSDSTLLNVMLKTPDLWEQYK